MEESNASDEVFQSGAEEMNARLDEYATEDEADDTAPEATEQAPEVDPVEPE